MTFFSLSAKNFAMILYRDPIKLIGLKSPKWIASLHLVAREINEELHPLVSLHPTSKYLTNPKISYFNKSQYSLKYLKVKPSDLGALSPPHDQTAFFNSSIENSPYRKPTSASESLWKPELWNNGLFGQPSLYFSSKKLAASYFISDGLVVQTSFAIIPWMWFFWFLLLT